MRGKWQCGTTLTQTTFFGGLEWGRYLRNSWKVPKKVAVRSYFSPNNVDWLAPPTVLTLAHTNRMGPGFGIYPSEPDHWIWVFSKFGRWKLLDHGLQAGPMTIGASVIVRVLRWAAHDYKKEKWKDFKTAFDFYLIIKKKYKNIWIFQKRVQVFHISFNQVLTIRIFKYVGNTIILFLISYLREMN